MFVITSLCGLICFFDRTVQCRLYSNCIILQMYDHVSEAEITLVNTGRVGFEFCALGMDPGMAAKPKPGVPVMIPHKVKLEIVQ